MGNCCCCCGDIVDGGVGSGGVRPDGSDSSSSGGGRDGRGGSGVSVSRQDSLVLDVCETVEKVEAVQFESSWASVFIKGTGYPNDPPYTGDGSNVNGGGGSSNNNNVQ